MKKRKPHYDLEEIKKVVADPNISPFTKRARRDGSELGLTPQEMRDVVLSLSGSDFEESMDTYWDCTVWHDVYYITIKGDVPVYIKLTGYVVGSATVISFHKRYEE